jgi:Phosphoserine phosphatase RsbU, N-terminal domain
MGGERLEMTSNIVNARAFGALYGPALQGFLQQPDERRRNVAYELGRDAVTAELSVLDLAVAHHDALGVALASADDAPPVVTAAGDFFLEALAAYEMVQRGYREAQEAAAVERRQAELLRKLSSFLADTSLALETLDSLEEVLQLLAEQTRELMRADICRVKLDTGFAEPIEALAATENTRWNRLLESQIGAAGDGTPHAETEQRTLREQLTTLAGRPIGSIEVTSGDFTELDAAVLVQLAEMASATVERRSLYGKR